MERRDMERYKTRGIINRQILGGSRWESKLPEKKGNYIWRRSDGIWRVCNVFEG